MELQLFLGLVRLHCILSRYLRHPTLHKVSATHSFFSPDAWSQVEVGLFIQRARRTRTNRSDPESGKGGSDSRDPTRDQGKVKI